MEELRVENSELWNSIRVYSSRWWDMNIPPEQLFEANPTCKLDDNYTNVKHTDAYRPYVVYLKHPDNDHYVGVGICEDGFVYMFDGNPSYDLPEVSTEEAVKLMVSYMNFIRAYQNFSHDCIMSDITNKEIIYRFVEK